MTRSSDVKRNIFYSPLQKCQKRTCWIFMHVFIVICTHWHIVQSSVRGCWSDLGQTLHLSQHKATGVAQKLVPVCQQRKPEDVGRQSVITCILTLDLISSVFFMGKFILGCIWIAQDMNNLRSNCSYIASQIDDTQTSDTDEPAQLWLGYTFRVFQGFMITARMSHGNKEYCFMIGW